MSSPPLCIGLPVYNGAKYLRETLDSILSQTFHDFELIVSDNASTDETPDIVKDYARTDPRITYERYGSNVGAAANFNSLLTAASSKYFKWAAADDTLAPSLLAKSIEVLDSRPEVGLVYPRTALMGPDSKTLYATDKIVELPDVWDPNPTARIRQYLNALLQDGLAANVMIFGVHRTEVVGKARPIGGYFGSDQVFVTELVAAAEVVQLPETMLFLRRHPESSSTYHRGPAAQTQQDFYDPSVRGSIKLQWNLRRRYLELLKVIGGVNVGPLERLNLLRALLAAIGGRVVWRIRFERDIRQGIEPPDLQWPGGPVHWSNVTGNEGTGQPDS